MTKNLTTSNTTELVFILDRSGSMAGLTSDTIGGFNAMIEKQKTTDGTVLVSTVLFDHETVVLHDRVPLEDVRPMTEHDYSARGSTALFDAVGGAIHHIGNIHKYARREDVPAKTLFVITTDGMENASRRYDREKVKSMIERQTKHFGWEFLFLGANIDAAETAESIGIHKDHAVDYVADARGTHKNYAAVSAAVTQVRACEPLGTEWRKDIDRDYQKRRGLFRK
ncbi:MAG: VWA domain-containing protein [Ruminococcaceae bacterium]|nr:VWA domain-containing protein [Oscillospiraceae bacterium]